MVKPINARITVKITIECDESIFKLINKTPEELYNIILEKTIEERKKLLKKVFKVISEFIE